MLTDRHIQSNEDNDIHRNIPYLSTRSTVAVQQKMVDIVHMEQ